MKRVSGFVLVTIAIFVVLYVAAAWLYPGGTRGDRSSPGFSLRDNYWCDLLDPVAYCGRPNPGRVLAVGAMLVLCAGLSVLWWHAPRLFPGAVRRARIVRISGIASGAVTPLVATSLHDLSINLASLFAVIAFGTTMSALGRRAGQLLVAVAAVTIVAALGDYLIWQTRIGLGALAGVQKVAFAAFLAWAALVARRLGEG
jgi:hypothetical protein